MASVTNPDLLKAVRCDGDYLEHVQLHEITPELCMAAVQQKGAALHYVPTKLRSLHGGRPVRAADAGTLRSGGRK